MKPSATFISSNQENLFKGQNRSIRKPPSSPFKMVGGNKRNINVSFGAFCWISSDARGHYLRWEGKKAKRSAAPESFSFSMACMKTQYLLFFFTREKCIYRGDGEKAPSGKNIETINLDISRVHNRASKKCRPFWGPYRVLVQ